MSFDPSNLEFGKATKMYPVIGDFKDEPAIPPGMMGSFGAAHPLWSGSSLDASGDVYGIVNVQRLTTLDPRHEEVRLFKITAHEQQEPGNPCLTGEALATVTQAKGEYSTYMHSFLLATKVCAMAGRVGRR